MVKTAESMAIEVVRLLMLAAQQPRIAQVTVRVNSDVAAYLNNRKRREISSLEDEAQMVVNVIGTDSVFPEHLEVTCRDVEGRELQIPS